MSYPNPGTGWNAPPPPPYQPPAQMGMREAVNSVLARYATFSGRARRSEYWWFFLAYLLAFIVAAVADAALGTMGLEVVLGLAVVIPSLAVGVRRLHDVGRSCWWMFLGLIPMVGAIVLLVFTCQDSEFGPNRWGPSPKYGF